MDRGHSRRSARRDPYRDECIVDRAFALPRDDRHRSAPQHGIQRCPWRNRRSDVFDRRYPPARLVDGLLDHPRQSVSARTRRAEKPRCGLRTGRKRNRHAPSPAQGLRRNRLGIDYDNRRPPHARLHELQGWRRSWHRPCQGRGDFDADRFHGPSRIPCHVRLLDSAHAKTVPQPRLGVLARLEHAARWVVLALFVAILAGSAFLQSRTETAYTLSTPDRVAEHFTPDNDIVLVYLNSNAEHIHEIADAVKRDPHAISVMGYPTTVGEPLTKGEMKSTLEKFEGSQASGNAIESTDGSDGSLALNDTALSMVYFAYHDGQAGTMTLREFVAAAREAENLSQKGKLGSFTSGGIGRIEGVDALERALDSGQVPGDVLGREFTPKQLASALKSMKEHGSEGDHSGDASDAAPIDKDDLTQLFVLHRALHESDPSWTMSLDDLVHFMLDESGQGGRFEGHLSTEQVSQLESAAADITDVRTRFVGTEFSRLIIRTDYPKESPETLAFVEKLISLADAKVPGEHFFVGDSAMVYEMREGFGAENVKIALFTAAAIFIIVALTFRSIAVPAILVLLVQVGVFITVSTVGLQGYSMYYLAMLIVQCILMGATIDYAIVLTTYYREARQEHGVRESLARAYDGSIHTILTSGLIMVLVTGVIGFLFSNPTVAQICRTIAIGAFAAIILIVGILPALLAVLDRVVAPKTRRRAHRDTAAKRHGAVRGGLELPYGHA